MSPHLLVATDFSEMARLARQRAAQLAATSDDARITVVHAAGHPNDEPSSAESAGSESVAAALAAEASHAEVALTALAGGDTLPMDATRTRARRVEAVLLNGSPRRVLAEYLESRPFDLAILGARGTRTVRDAVLGSTTQVVLRQTSRPLLAVRQPVTRPYRRVLAAFDGSPSATDAIRTACRWWPEAEFVLLQALDDSLNRSLRLADASAARLQQYRAQEHAEATHRLEEAAAALPIPTPQRRLLVAHGDPAPLVLSQATRVGAELIVMGKRGLSAVASLFVGSATQHVLAHASLDVLVTGPAA
jgi:nucleotide-binding universal stress UspA family protein